MQQKLRDWWEKKFFRVVAYMAFAVVSFFIFLLWTFPDHRVVDITANQIEEALEHRYEVSIREMSFWRLTGIEMSGVSLQERTPQIDNGDGGMALTIRLEQLAGRFSPLRSLLNRGPTASYRIDIGGGEAITGTAAQTGAEQKVTVSMNGLDLQQSTLIDSLLGVRILGTLDGDVDLTVDPATGLASRGHVDLRGEQITLGATTLETEFIPFLTQLELPTTSFGHMDVRLDFEDTADGSRIHFEEFTIRGRDIQAEAWGHIDMTPRGGQPDIGLRLQVNQEYVTEHDLGAVFNISEFREGEFEADDGHWYGFELTGRFDDPDFRGSRDAARGPGAGGDEEEE